MTKLVSLAEIKLAQSRIKEHLQVTPLTRSTSFSEQLKTNVYCKWDNLFSTGSFKERGACNFLQNLSENSRKKGVCAASAGNHALALSKHAARLGVNCTLVMPKGAPLVKIESARNFGAEIKLIGETFHEAYAFALQHAKEIGAIFVPAYDDLDIINGQGTAGLEILSQCSGVDCVIVPIGGGGLISGIATAIKESKPDTKIFGVKSKWAHETQTQELAKPGQTIADGIAIKNVGKITKPIIESLVDEIIVVDEEQIYKAIIRMLTSHRAVLEGAGAAGIAAFLDVNDMSEFKHIVFHLCGSNIDMNLLSRLIQRDAASKGKLMRIRIEVNDSPGHLNAITTVLAEAGANVLDVGHSRVFTSHPKIVAITVELELKNLAHREDVLRMLKSSNYDVQVLV